MSFDLFIINSISPVFYKLLSMSVTALCIGLVLMLLRRFADGKISPFWKYAMWSLVLAALIIPFRPQSSLALLNNTRKIQNVSFRDYERTARNQYLRYKMSNQSESLKLLPDTEELTKIQKDIDSLHMKSIVFELLIPLLWLIIMLSIILYMISSHIHLNHKLNRHSLRTKESHRILLEKCKTTLHISKNVRLLTQDFIDSPALTGLFHPKIILPSYVTDMSDESIEYILLHELSHLKRLDVLMNYLLIALRVFYSFNPVVWLLFQYIRQDMEVLNDTYVLKCIGSEYSKNYSRSLVEIVSRYNRLPYGSRLLCMVDWKDNMERRIKMIKLGKMFQQHKMAAALLSLAVIGIISVLFLTSNNKTDRAEFQVSDVGFQYPVFSDASVLNKGNKDTMIESESDRLESFEKLPLDNETTSMTLEQAAARAVLDNSYDRTELIAEGHILLGNEDKVDSEGNVVQTTAYILATIGGYEFVNNSFFVRTGGAGITPIRLTFDVDKNGYSLKEYKRPLDGSYYVSSIKEMFPEKLWDRAIENNLDDYDECQRQEQIYAQEYLQKIGRDAKIIDNISDVGIKNIPRNNKEIDTMIENFYKAHSDFPFWIGSIEKIEHNVRYVYETKWSGKENGEGNVTFIKYEYKSKKISNQYIIEIKNGKALYLEGMS